MTLIKITLFGVFGVMHCVHVVQGKKKNIIFHILYIIVAPLCSTFLKRVDFYKVRHALICQLSSAL